MIEYTLKLNSTQATEVLKAVDLLMRLKIDQPHEISRAVMQDDYWKDGKVNKKAFDGFLQRRDRADDYLQKAFREIFPTWEDVKKDDEWHTLYNILQALRYQRHLAESPCSTGVDSYPPMHFGGEPIPECRWRETKANEKNEDMERIIQMIKDQLKHCGPDPERDRNWVVFTADDAKKIQGELEAREERKP